MTPGEGQIWGLNPEPIMQLQIAAAAWCVQTRSWILPLQRFRLCQVTLVLVLVSAAVGALQVIRMNIERFSIPELLFHPSDIGIQEMGVAEAVVHTISQTPPGVFRTSRCD